MVKLQESKKQLRITIPKDISIIKNWKKGTEVFFIINSDGTISLKDLKELKSGRTDRK